MRPFASVVAANVPPLGVCCAARHPRSASVCGRPVAMAQAHTAAPEGRHFQVAVARFALCMVFLLQGTISTLFSEYYSSLTLRVFAYLYTIVARSSDTLQNSDHVVSRSRID